MYTYHKRYEDILSNFVSGYNWLQFLTVDLWKKAIAVYIYILYIIILCNHVTTVTNETVYAWKNYLFSYTCTQFWWLRWLHGYNRGVAIDFNVFCSGYKLVTTGYSGGYND